MCRFSKMQFEELITNLVNQKARYLRFETSGPKKNKYGICLPQADFLISIIL